MDKEKGDNMRKITETEYQQIYQDVLLAQPARLEGVCALVGELMEPWAVAQGGCPDKLVARLQLLAAKTIVTGFLLGDAGFSGTADGMECWLKAMLQTEQQKLLSRNTA